MLLLASCTNPFLLLYHFSRLLDVECLHFSFLYIFALGRRQRRKKIPLPSFVSLPNRIHRDYGKCLATGRQLFSLRFLQICTIVWLIKANKFLGQLAELSLQEHFGFPKFLTTRLKTNSIMNMMLIVTQNFSKLNQ